MMTQKQGYKLLGLTLTILLTISLINHQTEQHLLAKTINTHQVDQQKEPISLIDYSRLYHNQQSQNKKAFVIIFLVLWLGFLFSFVGIVASDFFCPNLSTISFRLGLSENLAGVTLLGFGNGAPDVFSTFAAMKANTGSLAIGELIGAASFIVSVVVGSMSISRPFKVPRHSFLRDIGFFIIAIIFVLFIVKEGVIHRWQANTLVLLYFIYVLAVLISSWSVERKRIKLDQLQIARSEYTHDDQLLEHYMDDPDFPIQPIPEEEPSALIPELSQDELTTNPSDRLSPQIGSPRPTAHRLQSSSSSRSHESFQTLLETSCYPLPLPVRQRRMRAPSLSYRAGNPYIGGINLLGQSTSTMSPNTSFPHPALPPPPPPRSNSSQDGLGSPELMVRRRKSSMIRNHPIRASLLGAIEFRDVVNSLARDSITAHQPLPRLPGSMSPQLSHSPAKGRRSRSGSMLVGHRPNNSISPATPNRRLPFPNRSDSDRPRRKTEFALPEINTFIPNRTRHRLTQSQSSIIPTLPRPWDLPKPVDSSPGIVEYSPGIVEGTAQENIINLTSSPQKHRSILLPNEQRPADKDRDPIIGPFQTPGSPTLKHKPRPLPSILITSDRHEILSLPDSPSQAECPVSHRPSSPNDDTRRQDRIRRWRVLIYVIWESLFPTLKDWKIKSLLGKIVAILSAPAVLVLTLTLPVVDETSEDDQDGSCFDDDDQGFEKFQALNGVVLEDNEAGLDESEEENTNTDISLNRDDADIDRSGLFGREGNCRRISWTKQARTPSNMTEEERDKHARVEGRSFQMTGSSYPMVDVTNPPISSSSMTRTSTPPDPHSSMIDVRLLVNGKIVDGDSKINRAQEDIKVVGSSSAQHLRSPFGSSPDDRALEEEEDQEEEEEDQEEEDDEEWRLDQIERDQYSSQHIARLLATIQSFLAPSFWFICLGSPSSSTTFESPPPPDEIIGSGISLTQLSGIRNYSLLFLESLVCFLTGLILSSLVYKYLKPPSSTNELVQQGLIQKVKISLCILGFINSMIWILNIVNEVIEILTTFGFIFGLSDSILGLTIFGIGNSLGDLVANVTLAKMGYPVMAFSASFGGPLLNILLGVGLSSSLIMSSTSSSTIHIHTSHSLLLSTIVLLIVLLFLLVYIPCVQKFSFDKHVGYALIASYCCVFTANLFVEIFLS
ncbi:hypothetical protein KEM48_012017 [Puccinia striiformis f. sp. tritici PST-130]|nr:hypothetical protein KEM48_012017 [Puccinia striiformis f. sp. tritici PST-130]